MMRMVAASSGLGRLLDSVRREVANCLRRVVHLAALECWQFHEGPDLTKAKATRRIGASEASTCSVVRVL